MSGATVRAMETSPGGVGSPAASHTVSPRDTFLAVLFNGPLVPTDAICVLSGDGRVRLEAAVGALRQGVAHWVLVSGGKADPPHSLTSEAMAGYLIGKGLSPHRIVQDPDSENTREQAEWLAETCAEKHLGRVLLVASPYHMPRAFLTVLQSLQDRDLAKHVGVIPLPAFCKWWEAPDGLETQRIDLLADEFRKIDEYGAKGHVASYEDGLAYLRAIEEGE